ncbi:MAG TPA: response regulator [Chthoniobacterales bacterium]|jgi:CheY-like chemotaxis protein|nr:response regulator [Chthoniobacterales bacterium]
MITIPAIGPLKFQFRRLQDVPLMFFLVLSAAMIAATVIVRTSVVGFAFKSEALVVWAILLALVATMFLLSHSNWATTRLNCVPWTRHEGSQKRNEFAETHHEPPLILLAASDVFMRSALEFHFTQAGFRVEHAATVDEALLKMKARPAAVLLDLGMRNGDGFGSLRNVRKASASSAIVAVTRKRHPRDAVRCRKLGANDSMPKPFDPTDAVAKIAHALDRKMVEAIPLRLSA